MISRISQVIEETGPLPLARAMAMAADHYYASKEPFGPQGDFVTAPEISQMFGELVGLWMADIWQRAGAPEAFILCELGPGRGTLMEDALRAARSAVAGFADAAQIHLVERSGRLRLLQRSRVPDATHHDDLADVPRGLPTLLIANEFLDALPLTQLERTADGWALRRVGADGWDISVAANEEMVPAALREEARPGQLYERNFASEALVQNVATRLAADGGAALFIDYGYQGPALGDTLQAIKGGAFADPLATLGEADISAHVDFARMVAVAQGHTRISGPVAQGQFLEMLGISQRAEALRRHAPLAQAAEVEAARVRLVSPGAMGRLFQCLALSSQGWPEPAGFPIPSA